MRCSCDELCLVYDDCCEDVNTFCPDVLLKASEIKRSLFGEEMEVGGSLFTACHSAGAPNPSSRFKVVTFCKENPEHGCNMNEFNLSVGTMTVSLRAAITMSHSAWS